ncbi:protein cordon-bleu isoform X2 [Genypterus blacodes]
MKARAPPPPPAPQPAPRHIFRSNAPDEGGPTDGEAKENMMRPTVELHITLPQGYQTTVMEDGSKALMDLLVELCSRYHLNPSLHTLELLTPEGQHLGFKPNALLGSLNVACVLIKKKVWEEKVVRRPAPKVPEIARPVEPLRAHAKKSVRLLVNYHSNQKAVVRVNPLVPLQALIPVICDKCEFDPAHVELLRDGISRHELPLDKSLAQLEIKQLYVHDQSLALQPKMASARALNYSDSIHSSTTSLNRTEKKGLLGIFQFRRKSKTESTSVDMDDTDDKVVENTDSHSSGPSTVSMVPCAEARPSILGQSQSVTNVSRVSSMADSKKRRAPIPPGALTPSMGHCSIESDQMDPGSESLRKRKAPAPPPTPLSITPSPDEASTSAPSTPDSHASETPTPALRTTTLQSTTLSSSTVVSKTTKPVSTKTVIQPLPATPTSSSASSSSTTIDSLAVQDSSSELSHSIEDSDTDPDTASGSTVSGQVQLRMTSSAPSASVEHSVQASSMAARTDQEAASSSSKSETESTLKLRLEEVENNRQSAIGTSDRTAPPKPRRSPAQESPQLVLVPTPSTPPLSTEHYIPQSPMEVEEAASQSWLHSQQRIKTNGLAQQTDSPEEETLSVGSSSGGSSLPDQGYAASEGMAEGEDSGLISSPSDTQPTSPDGSLSLDGNSGDGGERQGPVRDNSSDSDEGCATWGSRHRHKGINQEAKSDRLKDSYNQDPELTPSQLQQTFAHFEVDLAGRGHTHIVSAKETSYTRSTDSNEVPVSVVDMDVPVTAIDEVLDDYGHNIIENEPTLLTRTESAGSKGPKVCLEQNKNNNACTAGDNNKSSSVNGKQPSEAGQHGKSLENKSALGKVKDNIQTNKQMTPLAVKSNADIQKRSENSQIKTGPPKSNTPCYQEKKPVLPPTSQRSLSKERDEDMHNVNQHKSSTSTSHGKITYNFTSRFGTKTFTVVPSKSSVMHAATEKPVVTLTQGAIKIDDQGNMVKDGVSGNTLSGLLQSRVDCNEGAPLLGKAKAFWSSNEKQESAGPPGRSCSDKVKESNDGLKNTYTAVSETTKTTKTEDLKTTKPKETAQSTTRIEEKAKEQLKGVIVTNEDSVEVESKFALSIQQTSHKPAIPPPFLPDQKRDLSFLRPSRRTSSQYVASAITKYTPKTVVNPSNTTNVPVPTGSASLKSSFSFQKAGRSIHVNPHQSSQSTTSTIKESDSVSTLHPPGPVRSMSYPEYVSVRQRDLKQDKGALESCVASIKGTSHELETEGVRNKHIQSNSPSQIHVIANGDRDKEIHARSLSSTHSSALPSSAKLPTAVRPVYQHQTSTPQTPVEISSAVTHQTSNEKQEPSVIVSRSGVLPEPQQVTVFGPVKKFRPVISKSVHKETTLHSSLMEAIQTGGGKDRLKRTSTPGRSSLKKPSFAEEENERSALLTAIRAKTTSERLRKTKSEAAAELQQFRKGATEQESNADRPFSPSPISFSCTSPPLSPPPVFTPPPPPPMAAPPPPPPVSPQIKPSVVISPSGGARVDSALAREAMLEAIRSGSAAERLKKVAVPTKTVQVNGRLGTIQATSSTMAQQ